MKMPLSRIGRRRNALITSTTVLTSVGIFVLGFIILLLRVFAPDALVAAASPIWQAGQLVQSGYHAISSLFGNAAELALARDRLVLENQSIAEENRTLRAELADIRGLAREDGAVSGIVAGVLARPPVAPYDVLVIGAGTSEGVKVGDYVRGPGGVPLGTISSTADHSAQVELFSTGGRQTSAWIGEKRLATMLTGLGAGAFTATVPRNSGIGVNDVVYVPGPGALPIGTVAKVDTDPSSPRDTLHIAPYANLFALAWVTVK